MKQNQNPRHNRQGRPGQHNNQKRNGKSRHNPNRNQQPNSPTRQMDSRGPAGSMRGNAKQLYEKYKAMAQEKRPTDRLEFEALNQYADHYYRIYAEFAAVEAANQAKREQEQARKAERETERQVNSTATERSPSSGPRNQVSEKDTAENKMVQNHNDKPQNVKKEEQKTRSEEGSLVFGDVEKTPEKTSEKILAEPAAEKTSSEAVAETKTVPEKTVAEKPAPKKRRGRPPKAKPVEKTAGEDGETV